MRGNVGFSHARHRPGAPPRRRGDHGRGGRVHAPHLDRARAEQHASYKHFAELGEERFPVFLAVPIRGKAGPLGALVVQRSASRRSRTADVELLSVLGRPHRGRASATPSSSTRREKRSRARSRRGYAEGDAHRAARRSSGAPSEPSPRCGARRRDRASARPARAAGRRPTADVRLLAGAFDVAEKAIRGLSERARRHRPRARRGVPGDLRGDPRGRALPRARGGARAERRGRRRRRCRRSPAT